MAKQGWMKLVDGWPWYAGEGNFPVRPGSEYMAPLYVLRKPYGCWDPVAVDEKDPLGWPITEYEEALFLRPGFKDLAQRITHRLERLCHGDDHGFDEYKLEDNPYWPPELRARSKAIRHERYVLLMPLALSMTQDDKARVRWTLYGVSEQGPAKPFWMSFYSAPGVERPAKEGEDFFRLLLHSAYGESPKADLTQVGFRILKQGKVGLPFTNDEPIPSWAAPYVLKERQSIKGVKYLLTFRPFRMLPEAVRKGYMDGELHLLPFPGSLLFWGSPGYAKLQKQLPFAMQISLLHALERVWGVHTMRVPQAGWMHEPHGKGANAPVRGPVRGTFKRTWRQDRTARHKDETETAHEDKLARVLFSTAPHDVGLYDKPMARNAQIWNDEFELLLDGPHATPEDVRHAADTILEGGMFGYRIITPAMRVGRHEIYWQRPLVAFLSQYNRSTPIFEVPLGYLTVYPADSPKLPKPMEMYPRLLERPMHAENLRLFVHTGEAPDYPAAFDARKIIQTYEMMGKKPLDYTFAHHLLTVGKSQTFSEWLDWLPTKSETVGPARKFSGELEKLVQPRQPLPKKLPPSLTYEKTANREFEEAYWDAIADLSTGTFVNKNNADCVQDAATRAKLSHHDRDLEKMGDYLLERHRKAITDAGMQGKALAGELPFVWKTEYSFPWMGGWMLNQEGKTYERNLCVVIPGRDRKQAVILADHYDTAYMHDHYEKVYGGDGARISAAGADDNCSATAALLMAAPVLLQMSKEGKLACDVWLVHLTGEEYPAEGLGTCHLCEELVEGTVKLRQSPTDSRDLSKVRVKGVYVMDMIAHNSETGKDIFQISPGASKESLWLAYQAHVANRIWNQSVPFWNARGKRKEAPARGKRRAKGRKSPDMAQHLSLHGEVRTVYDARSTLFNTDGQMYSDVGVPVVLFMENYDISRRGYHDTHDTMALIDLDYGAALAAICIEATARAATEVP